MLSYDCQCNFYTALVCLIVWDYNLRDEILVFSNLASETWSLVRSFAVAVAFFYDTLGELCATLAYFDIYGCYARGCALCNVPG